MPSPSARDRVVYEVTKALQTERIEASTTTEFRDQLTRLIPNLEPYAVQAVTRLVVIERATVTTKSWAVRRLGVLVFQADPETTPETAPKTVPTQTEKPAEVQQPQATPPTAPPTNPEGVEPTEQQTQSEALSEVAAAVDSTLGQFSAVSEGT